MHVNMEKKPLQKEQKITTGHAAKTALAGVPNFVGDFTQRSKSLCLWQWLMSHVLCS